MTSSKEKIIPINWVNETERWVLIPSRQGKKRTRRIKKLHKVKGNCYFAVGVPSSIIDFIYRAVKKLNINEDHLLFSKGSVRRRGKPVSHAVNIEELDWNVGISILIPRTLNYSTLIDVLIDNKKEILRLMEVVILRGLLKISFKSKSEQWYSSMAAAIITRGWPQLEADKLPEVYLAD